MSERAGIRLFLLSFHRNPRRSRRQATKNSAKEFFDSQKFKQLCTERRTLLYPANFSDCARLDIICKFRGSERREFSPGRLVSAIIDLKFVTVGGEEEEEEVEGRKRGGGGGRRSIMSSGGNL